RNAIPRAGQGGARAGEPGSQPTLVGPLHGRYRPATTPGAPGAPDQEGHTMSIDVADPTATLHTQVDLTDLAQIADFTGAFFHELPGMSMSIKRMPIDGWWSVPRMIEMGPDGPVPVNADATKPGMHIVHAGTPHRVPHGWGYWHIGEVDEIYIWFPGD